MESFANILSDTSHDDPNDSSQTTEWLQVRIPVQVAANDKTKINHSKSYDTDLAKSCTANVSEQSLPYTSRDNSFCETEGALNHQQAVLLRLSVSI